MIQPNITFTSDRLIDGQESTVTHSKNHFQAMDFIINEVCHWRPWVKELTTTKVVFSTRCIAAFDTITMSGCEEHFHVVALVIAISIKWGLINNLVPGITDAANEIIDKLNEQQKKAIEFQRDNHKALKNRKLYLALGRVSEHNEMFYEKNIRDEDLLAAALLVEETKGESMERAFEWAKPLEFNFAGQPVGFSQ